MEQYVRRDSNLRDETENGDCHRSLKGSLSKVEMLKNAMTLLPSGSAGSVGQALEDDRAMYETITPLHS